MGQYFLIVNPARRQYLDICDLGENCKASGYMFGLHAAAVGILCCDATQVRSGGGETLHDFGALAGSWSGDRIYAAGDDHGPPNDFGIETATAENPERNLYRLAKEEFENITDAVVAMMCNGHEEYARKFVERLTEDSSDWVVFGRIVFERKVPNLEAALVERFGPDWPKIYKEARKKNPWRE